VITSIMEVSIPSAYIVLDAPRDILPCPKRCKQRVLIPSMMMITNTLCLHRFGQCASNMALRKLRR